MDRTSVTTADWPVVLTIHGIRTTGDWQRELTDVLTRHGFRHVPLGFGFFGALSLLIPWSRSRKVEWFRGIYSEKFASAKHPPSVVAHSFGSYIVANAMLKYDDICFDKVILCGSIVSRAYPWTKILVGRAQAYRVLNEAGGRDLWARLVEWVVSDAGASGVGGFLDLADGQVVQLIHERHEHSDYFHRRNFEQRWIPFLKGGPVAKVSPAGGTGINFRFLFTSCVLLLLVSLSIWLSTGHRSMGDLRSLVGPFTAGDTQRRGSDVPGESASGELTPPQSPPAMPAATAATQAAAPDQTFAAGAIDEAAFEEAAILEVKRRDRIGRWFAHLQGQWVQAGDLPQVVDTQQLNRCVRQRNTRTVLVFHSVDESKGVVSAKWEQHTIAVHRLQSLRNGPQPFDQASVERKECLGRQPTNPARRVFEEEGRFVAGALGDIDTPSVATLEIEDCAMDGQECPAAMFGERSIQPLEVIGGTRLRLGELIFARQVDPSSSDSRNTHD